jgi:hypothetical protein
MMRMMKSARWAFAVLLPVAVTLAAAAAQRPDSSRVRPSQRGSVSQHIADTTITLDYSRPVARGRELFGRLVPWGRIWCPGADDATTIQISSAIKIEGKDVPAGKYSLWTEPNPERWTVIVNRESSAWHTRYPEGQDQLRVEVKPRSGSHMETLAFYFPVVDGKKAELVLHWGTVIVPLAIEVP